MNARYVVLVLLLAGTVISGCVGDKPEGAVSDAAPHASPESGEAQATGDNIASSEFVELEFEDMESELAELAELEAMLDEIDGESDLLAEVDDLTFA